MDTAARDFHCCFIIQAVVPYFYDLNQILALPTGFKYQNSYNEQWVEPNLRDEVSQLLQRRVLIVMRDRERARLVPARWATIQVAQTIGDIYYFEYLLGDLIDYNRDPEARENDIKKYTNELHRYHKELPGPAGEDLLTPSVFLSAAGRDFPTVSADDLSHWGNVVAAVATANIYEKVSFLKVVDLKTVDGRSARSLGERYEVSPNTVYNLRVFHTMPNFGDGKVEPHDIDMNAFASHIALLRSRQRAVRKYNMLTFVLKVLDLAPKDQTSIQIEHESTYKPGLYAASPIYLPVVVEPRDRFEAVLRGAVAAAALIFMFKPDLAPGDADIIRNLATVFFVLVVSGSSWTLQSFWPNLPWR